MKIISFIEEQDVIKQILRHLGLWEIRNTGPSPRTNRNIVRELTDQPAPDHSPACQATGVADDGFFSQVPDLWLLGGIAKIHRPGDTVELS